MNDLLEKLAKTTAEHFLQMERRRDALEKIVIMLLLEQQEPTISFTKDEFKAAIKEKNFVGIELDCTESGVRCELVPPEKMEECERSHRTISLEKLRAKMKPPLN